MEQRPKGYSYNILSHYLQLFCHVYIYYKELIWIGTNLFGNKSNVYM